MRKIPIDCHVKRITSKIVENPKAQSCTVLRMVFFLIFLVLLVIISYTSWLKIRRSELRNNNKLMLKFDALCKAQQQLQLNETKLIRQQEQYFGYNIWLSERTCLQRELPDVRHKLCGSKQYEHLPNVSLIMSYHQLDASVLLRALQSIKDRTPESLLQQLILIDDASEQPELRSPEFHAHLKQLFGEKLQMQRLEQFVGSWRARLLAAAEATAEVLVFMDPYVEVNVDWLPPLLAPIKQSYLLSTTSHMDAISAQNLKYAPNAFQLAMYDWKLHKLLLPLRGKQQQQLPAPYETPLISSKVLAINRAWLFQLQAYQTDYYNPTVVQLELSMKIWLCGGKVLRVPCSRVGYLSTQVENHSEEEIQLDSWQDKFEGTKNFIDVWFDEYKHAVYNNIKQLKDLAGINTATQLEQRRQLQCKPADYYFRYVAPELLNMDAAQFPKLSVRGVLKVMGQPSLCLSSAQINSTNMLVLSSCIKSIVKKQQIWQLDEHGGLAQRGSCVESLPGNVTHLMRLSDCNYTEPSAHQYWSYDFDTLQFQWHNPGNITLCLQALTRYKLIISRPCEKHNIYQKWTFQPFNQTVYDSYIEQWWPNK